MVLTEMEHHSNIVPWQLAGARLEYVRIDDEGCLDLDHLDELLAKGPKLVSVAHVSNVLGTINPVEEIVRRARAAGALSVIDGAQAVPQIPVDLAGDRRRLLRLDRPQGLRADRDRRAARPASSCSRRCRRSSAAAT